MFETWVSQLTAFLIAGAIISALLAGRQRIQFGAFVVSSTWVLSQLLTFFLSDLAPEWLFFILNMWTLAGMLYVGWPTSAERMPPPWTRWALLPEFLMLPAHPLSDDLKDWLGYYDGTNAYIGWVNICFWWTISVIIFAGISVIWKRDTEDAS
ncbi:MAG: hypothetical protein MRY72_02110 [Aquisalinus sp.]|nr:hypothetical protein [Aquisalinus sp.]